MIIYSRKRVRDLTQKNLPYIVFLAVWNCAVLQTFLAVLEPKHIAPALFCIGINVLLGRSSWATPTTDPFSTPASSIQPFVQLFIMQPFQRLQNRL